MFHSDESCDDPEVQLHAAAIVALGAEAVVLSKDLTTAGLLDRLGLSGVIFSGGGDVSALRYGGEVRLANDRVDDQRDEFEMSLMRRVLDTGIAALCICRGLQVANVVLGGTLIEHVPEYLGDAYTVSHHQRKDLGLDTSAYAHEINVVPQTIFHKIVRADRLRVNSFHHQAIRTVGPGLIVAARADDGIVEAVERDRASGFLLGIQWHPEQLQGKDAHSARIYERFVQECRGEAV
jgi:putative glutamine amidotransferase